MNIRFCGAAREVTGSCHLLTLDSGYTILLDCGLYQGDPDPEMQHFNREFLFDPASIDCLVLSHAHIDHAGRIPKLYRDGFRGEIICTHATRSLANIMLMDSARIQERDSSYGHRHDLEEEEPLYTVLDVNAVLKHFTGVGYQRWHQLGPGVRVYFTDAGHILGAASVTLEIEENGRKTLFGFTGDVGRPNRPILRNPQPMPEVDYLICESTYGDRDHESAPDEETRFLEIIRETCVERKGKLLIPAFSVGRTQEIVYMLDKLERAGLLPRLPVYVDSPLAIDATQIFLAHTECFDQDLLDYMLTDPNPFGFHQLQYIRSTEASKRLNDSREPCIVISASGMANAGRIRHHLAHSLENPNDAVLLVGYCSPNTPGGRLKDGANSLRLFGQTKTVRLRVYEMDSFSAHADRNELLAFLSNQQRLKKLFLVHGTYDSQEAFRTMLHKNGFPHIEIPALGDTFELA
jgi:metallo-beta-lactamase family protein